MNCCARLATLALIRLLVVAMLLLLLLVGFVALTLAVDVAVLLTVPPALLSRLTNSASEDADESAEKVTLPGGKNDNSCGQASVPPTMPLFFGV